MGHLDRAGATTVPTFPELSTVRLKSSVQIGQDRLPAGSEGVVVFAYRDGAAYEVEFITPFAAVLTLGAGDLTL